MNTGVDPSKGGRPLRFQSAEQLQAELDAYFAECEAGIEIETVSQGRVVKVMEKQPYTITGICTVMDIDRHTLLDYGTGKYDEIDPEFSTTVKKAKAKVLGQIEKNLYNGKPAAGAIFSLKNNNGWVDKTEQAVSADVTTKGEALPNTGADYLATVLDKIKADTAAAADK